MSVRAIRRENLPATIAGDLRRQIRSGDLEPGGQLPGHRELAALYSVSVGSVREAISMLISAGLVETRAGRGTYVVDGEDLPPPTSTVEPLGRREVEELIEAREVIELQLAELAARRASPEQLQKLKRCLAAMEAAAASPDGYPDADVEFHLALAEAAGNRYLLKAMTDTRALLKQDMELGAEAAIRRFGDLSISIADHRRLVEAIEAGDPEGARRVLAEIVSRNHRFVLGLYALGPSQQAAGARG
jgi:GntR family transcriptional regulator, transcriptional repressor for pyruvate dehydrogenase complex